MRKGLSVLVVVLLVVLSVLVVVGGGVSAGYSGEKYYGLFE